MAIDYSKMDDNQLLQLYQQEKAIREQAKTQPVKPQGLTQSDDINALISSSLGQKNIGHRIGDAISILGGGKPTEDSGSDLAKLYAQEMIKSKFEDPTVRQLREAEIEALKSAPPQGFVRIGKQIHVDPEYIKPVDQRKIDEEERAKLEHQESLKELARENLGTIQAVKEGAKFFGPMGDVPSVYAPSSFMGVGNYGERKKWESNVDKLLSQKVIDVMTELKSQSKTGASGFGALSEKELAVLRGASTALNRGLTPKDALVYLDEMEKIHKKVLGEEPLNQTPSTDQNDPIVRTGTDQETGQRVGMTKSGKVVPLGN